MTTENRLPAVPSTASEHSPDATDGPNSSHHGRQDAYRREIVYSREDRDYKMVLDGECVGYARTYTEAERTLDALVLELIGSASPVVHARPAEVVEPVYVAPTDGLLLTCASCGATKPLTAFVNVDQEVVCDACLAADARAGDGPATSAATDLAEPASPASAATSAALPFTRTKQHDLRQPQHILDADAWLCGDCHEIFWVDAGYTPLLCPRCEHQAAHPPLDLRAEEQRAQNEVVMAGLRVQAHLTRDRAGFMREYALLTAPQRERLAWTYGTALLSEQDGMLS